MQQIFNKIKTWFNKDSWVYSISLLVVVVGVAVLFFRVRGAITDSNVSSYERYHDRTRATASLIGSTLELGHANAASLSSLHQVDDFLTGDTSYYDNLQNSLIRFESATDASAVYILDTEGTCVLSSDESFLSNDYSFRPYFQDALEGNDGFYPAVGVTSKLLGLYFSHPIYVDEEFVGVSVYKSDGENVREIISSVVQDPKDFAGLETYTGVVFLSNHRGRLYVREKLTQNEIAGLENARQFPLDDLDLWGFELSDTRLNEDFYVDENDVRYVLSAKDVPDYDMRFLQLSPNETVTESTVLIKREVYWIAFSGVVMFASFLYLFLLFVRYYRDQFKVRRKLSETEKALEETVDNIPLGIIRTTPKGRINYINKRGLEIFGFKNLAEARSRPITSFYVNKKDREYLLSELKKTGHAHLDRLEMYNAGRTKIQFLKADLWMDENGEDLEAAFENVTKGVIASERLKAAAFSSSDIIIETDSKGRVTYCSRNVEGVLGYASEELLGKTLYDFMQKDDEVRAERQWKSAIEKEEDIRDMVNEYLHRDGSVVVLEVNANTFENSKGDLQGYRGAAKDLTKLLSQREELEMLSNAVEQSANTILITDIDGNIEYVNPYFEKLTGYSREEVIGENPSILNSGYHKKSFYKNLWDTILAGEVWKGRVRNQKKDGSYFWEESTITPILDDEGEISHFMAVKENITKRKELEEERALYQLITKNIGDELYLINTDEEFELVNKTAANSLQMSVKELVSLNLKDIDPDYIKDIWKERLLSAKDSEHTDKIEVIFSAKDDNPRVKALTLRYLKYKGHDYLLAIGRDITERKTTEEMEKERLEELERLNRLTAGREYKIVELQDKVKDLEEKLSKFNKYFGDE